MTGKTLTIEQASDALEFDLFQGDFGSPGDCELSNKIVTSRGKYVCFICRGPIIKGEEHRSATYKFDGEIMAYRCCNACCVAMASSVTCDYIDILNEDSEDVDPIDARYALGEERRMNLMENNRLTDERRAELRKFAIYADGEIWHYVRTSLHSNAYITNEKGSTIINLTNGEVPANCAGFIEVANPSTVLLLLDELEAKEAERKEHQKPLAPLMKAECAICGKNCSHPHIHPMRAVPVEPQLTPEAKAAIDTLKSQRYTWTGGEKWRPPRGLPPESITGIDYKVLVEEIAHIVQGNLDNVGSLLDAVRDMKVDRDGVPVEVK